MKQVRIFKEDNIEYLQKSINQWISKQKDKFKVHIINVKPTMTHNDKTGMDYDTYLGIIVYQEKDVQ